MAHIFNGGNINYKVRQSPIPEFSWHTSEKLAELVGSKHLKFDVRSLDPDKYSYPYHFHRNAEEIFVILEGSGTLRTPEGFKEIKAGDVIFFEMGPYGAHQLYNHTNEPLKFLDIRTDVGFDVCEYPDSGKINICDKEVYELGEKADYYKGEDKVREKWKGGTS